MEEVIKNELDKTGGWWAKKKGGERRSWTNAVGKNLERTQWEKGRTSIEGWRIAIGVINWSGGNGEYCRKEAEQITWI